MPAHLSFTSGLGTRGVSDMSNTTFEFAEQPRCLSLPGFYAEITRPAEARVNYTDEKGKQQTIDVDGLLSVCIQHEIDHLNGILFVDHLSSLKRNMILKKMVKMKKEQVN